MTRNSDDSLRPLLLGRIVEAVVGRPIADMTFRGLAKDLGVSTYNLVYHFGSRDHLVGEIVREVAQRESARQPAIDAIGFEQYERSVRNYCVQSVSPESLLLRRTWVGACLGSSRLADSFDPYEISIEQLAGAMNGLGLDASAARIEAELLTGSLWGLQLAALVRPAHLARAETLERLLDSHLARVADAIGASYDSTERSAR